MIWFGFGFILSTRSDRKGSSNSLRQGGERGLLTYWLCLKRRVKKRRIVPTPFMVRSSNLTQIDNHLFHSFTSISNSVCFPKCFFLGFSVVRPYTWPTTTLHGSKSLPVSTPCREPCHTSTGQYSFSLPFYFLLGLGLLLTLPVPDDNWLRVASRPPPVYNLLVPDKCKTPVTWQNESDSQTNLQLFQLG